MIKGDRGTGNERFSTLPQFSLEAGGINGPRYKRELSRGGVYVFSYGGELLDGQIKPDKQEIVPSVKFHLRDVGIRDWVSGPGAYDKVVRAIRKEGLDLLPQLAAAETALNHADIISEGEWVRFLSKPMTGRRGYRSVFVLARDGGKLELDGGRADDVWHPDDLAAARLR